MLLQIVIAIVALAGGVNAYAMNARLIQSLQGRLREPSVVQLPQARALFGIPNSALGLAYYGLALAAALVHVRLVTVAAAASSILALSLSTYLAVQLIHRHLDCRRCWTAHAVNALLCSLLIAAAVR